MTMASQSTFTDAIADEIAQRLSEGQPLRQICRDERMPAWRTVYDWIKANSEFADRIAQARALGHDALAEECLEIADDGSNDWEEREHARTGATYVALNEEAVQRSKLRVWTRLQLLAKWNPKKYGDKIQTEVSGPGGGPIQQVAMSQEQFADTAKKIASEV